MNKVYFIIIRFIIKQIFIKMQPAISLLSMTMMIIFFVSNSMALPANNGIVSMPNGINGMGRQHQSVGAVPVSYSNSQEP